MSRPATSLGTRSGEEFSERGPNFLNYVQYFQTMSDRFFQGGGRQKFMVAWLPLRSNGYGLGNEHSRLQWCILMPESHLILILFPKLLTTGFCIHSFELNGKLPGIFWCTQTCKTRWKHPVECLDIYLWITWYGLTNQISSTSDIASGSLNCTEIRNEGNSAQFQ